MPAYPGDSAERIAAALARVPATDSSVAGVTKRLLDFFTSGEIDKGTRLPPERALAESMGVGRSAIRESLAALEILGVVDVKPGSGTYLRGGASELLPQTLSWGMLLSEPQTRDLIETRGELEIAAARLAAARIGDAELRLLEQHLDAMRTHQDDPVRFIEADLKFHLQVAESSGNKVVFDLLQSIRSLLRIWVERGLRSESEAHLAYDEHREVLDALRTHDPARAQAAMQHHMQTAGARLSATIEAHPAEA